jgi:hypothetical protein
MEIIPRSQQSRDREGAGIQEIRAGHIGITMPGTRRILYVYEDTEWTTFYATDKTDPDEIVAEVTEPHDFDRHPFCPASWATN